MRENLEIANGLNGLDLWLKIGLLSFIAHGWEFVDLARSESGSLPIFLDLKLHDIPNTTADAAEAIADRGVEMFNVHASIGAKAMEMLSNRLALSRSRPIALAVTALTSFGEDEFAAIYHAPIGAAAIEMASNAYKSGLDGVVCSVHESLAIKEATHRGFLTLTPGIRLAGESVHDQTRIATPSEAKRQMSDFIVMGRSIIGAADPRKAAENVLAQIAATK
jgi:orotidine-5'-phosphate decarboxylase